MIEFLVWFWVGVFILAIVLEAATVDFVALWFALAALPSFVIALIGGPLWLQIIVFLIVSILLLAYTRPYMVKYFKKNRIKTNVHAAIGKIAVVSKEITPNSIGAVTLRGIRWSAVSNETIKKGDELRILDIEGVKLIVESIKK